MKKREQTRERKRRGRGNRVQKTQEYKPGLCHPVLLSKYPQKYQSQAIVLHLQYYSRTNYPLWHIYFSNHLWNIASEGQMFPLYTVADHQFSVAADQVPLVDKSAF